MDDKIRLIAFDWLDKQILVYGDVLPREILANSFNFKERELHWLYLREYGSPKINSDIPKIGSGLISQ